MEMTIQRKKAIKAMKLPSAASLMQKIRILSKDIHIGVEKVRRQKLELYQSVYLYCEVCATEDQWNCRDCYDYLAKSVGRHPKTWENYRKQGELIRMQQLDLDMVVPAALYVLPKVIEPKDLPKIAKLLNDGASAAKVEKTMIEMGYSHLPPVPEHTRKAIRMHKHEWKDWTKEMKQLLANMAHTSDAKTLKLALRLMVNGKVAIEVKG